MKTDSNLYNRAGLPTHSVDSRNMRTIADKYQLLSRYSGVIKVFMDHEPYGRSSVPFVSESGKCPSWSDANDPEDVAVHSECLEVTHPTMCRQVTGKCILVSSPWEHSPFLTTLPHTILKFTLQIQPTETSTELSLTHFSRPLWALKTVS